MQDRPDADELATAVARFLIEQVRPAVSRDLRFSVLVAANACAILAREAQAGPAERDAERRRLARLLRGEPPEDVRVGQRELAGAIRAGTIDERWPEAVEVLRESVRAKLAIAHPGYDAISDDGR